MDNKMIVCPECRREIPKDADRCPNCGYPLKSESAIKAVNQADPKMRIVGIALFIVGIIFAFQSYKTRYMGDYDHYTSVIGQYEDSILDYEDSKQEMIDMANSYAPGLFRYSYNNLADDYQGLIDDAVVKIDEYRGKQHAIVMKALLMLITAIGAVSAGGFFITLKSGGKVLWH